MTIEEGAVTLMLSTPNPTHPLVPELLRVHDLVREDLRTCRDLADAAAGSAQAAPLREAVDELAGRSLLFQLRTRCLGYCRLVHDHHRGEDLVLLPAARRSAPERAAVLDRLQRDHRVVSDLLDEIETEAWRLDDSASGAARTRLVDALRTLSDHLLEHLDVEERALAPVLQTWESWPHQ
ncbi:hemerythrin HHE cation binding domain-containing protein [Actinomycetospora cinnamomea]|uniref:Hemerythrin HHE cation binding domain-containing protein n=2 Tax=Actinomycetospora cinnamomea TaxID=663609 RepID=A0A2U1EAK3_9PSEU|nr:hemerythrin HHE cation binding domain-containing protein [Actinomycetospora cinnamomea]